MYDGSGTAIEPKPCPGQYRPKHQLVQMQRRQPILWDKEVRQGLSVEQKLRLQKTQSNSEQGIICSNLLKALKIANAGKLNE